MPITVMLHQSQVYKGIASSVAELKMKIFQSIGILPDRQVLMFGGIPLSDGKLRRLNLC